MEPGGRKAVAEVGTGGGVSIGGESKSLSTKDRMGRGDSSDTKGAPPLRGADAPPRCPDRNISSSTTSFCWTKKDERPCVPSPWFHTPDGMGEPCAETSVHAFCSRLIQSCIASGSNSFDSSPRLLISRVYSPCASIQCNNPQGRLRNTSKPHQRLECPLSL